MTDLKLYNFRYVHNYSIFMIMLFSLVLTSCQDKEFSRQEIFDEAFFKEHSNFAIASISSDLVLNAKRSDNPPVNRELCRIHFKELLDCFNKNGLSVSPIKDVIENDLYKSLEKEKRNAAKIPLLPDLEIIRGADFNTYALLAKSLGVDGIIIIWNRYHFAEFAKSGFFGMIFKGILRPKLFFTGSEKTDYNCILESHIQIYGINEKLVFNHEIKKISDATLPGEKKFYVIGFSDKASFPDMKTLVIDMARFHSLELNKRF